MRARSCGTQRRVSPALRHLDVTRNSVLHRTQGSPERRQVCDVKSMNALLRTLGVRVPIVQAPMAGVSSPAMAAAVSNAGGLGSIGVGSSNANAARQMIAAVRAATDGPINVNVFCHRPATADREREAAWIAR